MPIHKTYPTPLPIDPNAAIVALINATLRRGSETLPDTLAESLHNWFSRIYTATPQQDALALADAWVDLCNWRMSDSRTGLRIVVADHHSARRLRQLGYNAITAFVHARDKRLTGLGLIIGLNLSTVAKDDLRAFVSAPSTVRVIMLDKKSEEG